MNATDVGQLFLQRARYYMETEYRTKLRCAVEALPAEMLWWRPNESSNSVGNLILHLIGNVRQWIVSGVGGAPDSRNRMSEFSTRDGMPASELLIELERVLQQADRVLGSVGPEALLDRRVIQGEETTVFEAVLRVVQHFSQHLGQIIWIAKLHAPGAINFVEGDAHGHTRAVWRELVRPPQV